MNTATNVATTGEVSIKEENDIVSARRTVREVAIRLGFGQTDVTRIVTAASELARNIFKYAGEGVMHWHRVETGGRIGLELQFIDKGPGIQDLDLAMQDGFPRVAAGMGFPAPDGSWMIYKSNRRQAEALWSH
jgi:serine/threonine-protein kinase RsbT